MWVEGHDLEFDGFHTGNLEGDSIFEGQIPRMKRYSTGHPGRCFKHCFAGHSAVEEGRLEFPFRPPFPVILEQRLDGLW